MALRRGQIIDVDLEPTKGSETGKIRPCIIVTNDVYNARVPVIQVVPITEWSEKKARIMTNIELEPSASNGLTKRSIADCLQTRPIDHRQRLVRGGVNCFQKIWQRSIGHSSWYLDWEGKC
jgi:mRNA interferase MazF